MDIKVFKLLTGEEVIGELVNFEGEVFIVKHPLGIGVNHEESCLVFVPYMPYTSAPEEIAFPVTSLLLEPLAPIDSIAEDYKRTIQRIFQKIITPERSIIRPVK